MQLQRNFTYIENLENIKGYFNEITIMCILILFCLAITPGLAQSLTAGSKFKKSLLEVVKGLGLENTYSVRIEVGWVNGVWDIAQR